MKHLRTYLWCTALVLVSQGRAQGVLVSGDLHTQMSVERALLQAKPSAHTSVRPMTGWDAEQAGKSLLMNRGFTKRFRPRNHTVCLTPIIKASGFNASLGSKRTGLESYAGIGLFGFVRKWNVGYEAQWIGGYNEPAAYLAAIYDSLNVAPGIGTYRRRGGYAYQQTTFAIGWRPSDWAQIILGRGRPFIGEGYRSIQLDDNVSPYNYLRTDITVWKLKYSLMYAQLKHDRGYPAGAYDLRTKYMTSHHIDLNVTRWWSLGAYEAIIWQTSDSTLKREFDIHYLNPIIFFRPQEYSIGSTDNALLGAHSIVRPLRGLTLYGVIMLDEFLLNEWLAPFYSKLYPDSLIATGSWRNKQAYQLGLKYHQPFGWKDATIIAEVNAVRPFTFAHANPAQAYTHLNQPLAHPLGSNVLEWVAVALWQPGKWNVGLRATYARKGYDDGQNRGENVLRSYSEVLNSPTAWFGQYLLQGRLNDVGNVRLDVGYTLIPAWQLRVEAAMHLRTWRVQSTTTQTMFVYLGFRTALWNEDYNL